jgi:hypothetical protein
MYGLLGVWYVTRYPVPDFCTASQRQTLELITGATLFHDPDDRITPADKYTISSYGLSDPEMKSLLEITQANRLADYPQSISQIFLDNIEKVPPSK